MKIIFSTIFKVLKNADNENNGATVVKTETEEAKTEEAKETESAN